MVGLNLFSSVLPIQFIPLVSSCHLICSAYYFRLYFFCNNPSTLNPLRGTAIVANNALAPQHITSLDDSSLDSTWASIKINSQTKCLVGSIYFPPSSDDQNFKLLLKHITKAKDYASKHRLQRILLFGDFNARMTIWGDKTNNSRGLLLSEFLSDDSNSDLTISVPNGETFSSHNGGSVIDLLILSNQIQPSLLCSRE